ncbi:BlaI/MecI/CopY family transcriptional regulator [Tuwongella immobilis]|uniref:Uncharacterized protein n=1 Tax=Tuwongella immobilis TaxID=692036 RepID=A0A6C2YTW8_9BACT|nr:BlaI/MecI/CopY family transcriptional regulator [Tuwongella immobilis]VIP04797.1 transcriptional regulator : Putative transcriptional regulator OS=Singulisphaera acidiphila (strain ATCC BAA-1392 / DSM 18658 / VKM B-2454 / MOB10) GN=Sinac_1395 PE=4 SV=1: Penicillinase_R [Tuwongella immobilis]VTS06954.1 transcriptional regulator : Putative transcriptional regulator OS=Singulisphaera acidiphila (strain ATCC BAA-1392 / DSM 18658 / VKM B-2454 / MOB10) GN=Sinac_1395 PE=4 SV=1: Penicillinase_R [Tuwon
MARSPEDVTDAELAVLQELWERGPCTVRAIVETLYPEGTAAQVATVQTLLTRLEKKAFVRRDRQGPVQQFFATIQREELIGRRVQDIVEQLCDGSMTPLLTHLVQADRLSPQDRQALRQLIDQLDSDGPNDAPASAGSH